MESSMITPNLYAEERQDKYPFIQENEELKYKSLKMVFGKFGSNHRSKIAQLLNADHFVVFIFSSEFDKIQDADNIDLFHLYPKRGINRILVEEQESIDEHIDDGLKLYEPQTIYNKGYSELIDFCKAKDDQRATYYKMADNCHKFCIDFADFCDVDCSSIAFTDIALCFYGLINFMKFCAYCVANHHYRVYIYCTMFLLWSIFSVAWWTQISSFNNSMKSQFASCATGVFFILFSSFITIIKRFCDAYSYKHYRDDTYSKYTMYFSAILFIVGGICYWFGGFAVTGIIRTTLRPICDQISRGHKGYCSAFAGIWFTECSLIGVNSIIFGFDMITKVLNYHLFRKFFNLGLLAFISLVGFFCFAILSTNLLNIKQDGGYSTLGAVAAAYFFIFCISSFYICWNIYKYYRVNEEEDYDWGPRIILDISCLCCFLFFGLMLICGYWAMTSYNDKSIQQSVLNETNLNGTYLVVYWVGMSFFWSFFLFIIISDMYIGIPDSFNIKGGMEEIYDESD